ncbi:hypothetical protein EOD41_16395 [Mucilaginibacter limnophilus]|uniref:Cupin domain-containing protein n=1 Tax=Mucilaginibacter limnophilus TaxID=1932778 RepID=A0A3S2V6I4_9SPHI|nr:hypothetical protein [Mucilaginibacter limnophilus]RVT98372.1 hypothetical protein EOD41_16395 [Mucilaginibacter limnophilus]
MEIFKVTRIYTDANSDSRFEDIEYPLHPNGTIGALSEKVNVTGLFFRTVLPTYNYDFHNAPQKQFIILLDGELEIETSTGGKRTFGAGEVLQVEDTEGKGHRTRNLKPTERRSIFVTFD